MITSQAGRAVTASNQRVHSITSLNVKCKSNRYHAFFIALLYERPRASADMYGGHRKYHACHANRGRGAESVTPATQDPAAPKRSSCVAELPLTSMEVPKVPRLPRKSRLRSRLPRKIQRRQIGPHSSPSFRGHLWRYRKYHACHANPG